MAHGDEMDRGRGSGNRHFAIFLLLDKAISQGDGPWVDVRGYSGLSVEVQGLGKDVAGYVEIRGTHHPKPSQALAGFQMGPALLDDGIALVSAPIAWLRASIPAHAPPPSEPITVILHALA